MSVRPIGANLRITFGLFFFVCQRQQSLGIMLLSLVNELSFTWDEWRLFAFAPTTRKTSLCRFNENAIWWQTQKHTRRRVLVTWTRWTWSSRRVCFPLLLLASLLVPFLNFSFDICWAFLSLIGKSSSLVQPTDAVVTAIPFRYFQMRHFFPSFFFFFYLS